MTFHYVLACSDIVLGGYKPIRQQERLVVSVWVHEKGRRGQTYDDMNGDFLSINKAAPPEADLL
jgi:hypothetical protein